MERKAFTNLMEASARVLLGETHMIGKTVIVKGKKGKVVKQVSSDGKTESDEIYQVKFEDGTVEDIPARDMEMQGDTENRKEPSENEAEDIVNSESVEVDEGSFWGRDDMVAQMKAAQKKAGMVTLRRDHEGGTHGTTISGKKKEEIERLKKAGYKVVKDHVELDEGKFKAHSGIPGMSKKGKGILSHMANSFETTGGPWLDHDNVHNLTHHGVNQTLKKAHQHLKNNPHPEALEQLALVKKELGESIELKESYDKKGLLKKGLTHAVHSKGPDGQIHFTARSKKTAQFKAKMYTNAIQWTNKTHPGFGIKIVPQGTPNGKSVHQDHERYYGKTDESVELGEGRMKEIDIRRKEGETPEQIAKGMKVNVKDVKHVLRGRRMSPHERLAAAVDRIKASKMKKHESVEIEEGGKDVVKKGKPITIGLDIKNPIQGKKKKLKADDPPSEDLLNTIINIVNTANTRAIHNKDTK